MPNKLNQEELSKELTEAFACYQAWTRQSGKKNIDGSILKSKQAYNQLCLLIQQDKKESEIIKKEQEKMSEHEVRTELVRLRAKVNRMEQEGKKDWLIQRKVSREFVERWAWKEYQFGTPSQRIILLTNMLKELSFKVED